MTLGVVLFVIAIIVVVMIHEAGHFLVAKLFNFKATKFFFGFGPTVWSFTRGETEYGVKAIPAGGFVKIVGMNPYEEVPEEDRPRAYSNKPRWQRALVLVAGSGTHFIVAFVILLVTAVTIGYPTGRVTNEVAAVNGVRGATTPAIEAGIQPGDRIVGVGGQATSSWAEIRSYIRANGGRRASFTVESDGETRTVEVMLGQAIFDEDGEVVGYAAPGEELRELEPGETTSGFFGVSPEPEYETKSFLGAIPDAGSKTWYVVQRSVLGIGDVFGMVFGGELWDALTSDGDRAIDEGPLGLVGAGRIAGESVQQGNLLDLIALIVGFTVFVGIMNLLPLPPLDGGHLAVLAWEKVTGHEVDVRKLIPVAAAVISFFVLLFIAVLYLDLARPIKAPF
jgi:membrane-associated protease RseP (regulator of RpoE activity)